MTETQKRGMQNIKDANSAQEFFSENKELLKSMEDHFKSKNAPAVSKFLETIANVAAISGKQIDGEDLHVEKTGNELHFKIGDSSPIKINATTGNPTSNTILTVKQKE